MLYTNSPLVVHTNLSPNIYGLRTSVIDTFTPHVVVGHATLTNLGVWFAEKSRKASSNYGIDDYGQIAMFVEEKNAACTTSSRSNDNRSITVEVASDASHPYAITNGAMDGLIKLGADICKRNSIPKLLWRKDKSLLGIVDQQNITCHRWFAPKACPGDYVFSRLGEIAEEVNALLTPTVFILPYQVKINTGILHYRTGPGTNNPIIGQLHKGEIYTIVEEDSGLGASKWGKLKSGAGWISLDYCMKVR